MSRYSQHCTINPSVSFCGLTKSAAGAFFSFFLVEMIHHFLMLCFLLLCAACGYVSCVILNNTDVRCWGSGLGLEWESWIPDYPVQNGAGGKIEIGAGRTIVNLGSSLYHTCAILNDTSLTCWGGRDHDPPEEVDLGGRNAIFVDGAEAHECMVLADYSTICVGGSNDSGQMGQGNNIVVTWEDVNYCDGCPQMGVKESPAINFGTNAQGAAHTVKTVATGDGYGSCVILDDGTVKCWGRFAESDERSLYVGNEAGEMGDNLPYVNLGAGRTAVFLTRGQSHACAILDDDSVKCWGKNDKGQLGQGDTEHRETTSGLEMGDNLPTVDLGLGRTAVLLSGGYAHTCALLDNNDVKCWGRNSFGTSGSGDTDHKGDEPGEMGDNLLPIDFGIGVHAIFLAAGRHHNCAILSNQSLKCWGYNNGGNLGLGDKHHRGDHPGEMGDNLPALDFGGATVSLAFKATDSPTASPSAAPSSNPTAGPTTMPTAVPSALPTATPSTLPTATPSTRPTLDPTNVPTLRPTSPTARPTEFPTESPTENPTPEVWYCFSVLPFTPFS
jgi:alpha-tubulin suppressor-like RCC1 family protein